MRFPFGKFDMLLAPAFPFGGMEHVGAIFYNESRFVFREPPTLTQRLGRNATIYHEVAHQWFGDLVTMRWFDDLWLKEGFATYMAAKMQADLAPGTGAWKTFYLRNKPLAYAIDQTTGTTPVWQELENLDLAKSNYGPIVYNKAPSILKQLNYLVGEEAFREGLRLFLRRHAYANATWEDLLAALEESSGHVAGRLRRAVHPPRRDADRGAGRWRRRADASHGSPSSSARRGSWRGTRAAGGPAGCACGSATTTARTWCSPSPSPARQTVVEAAARPPRTRTASSRTTRTSATASSSSTPRAPRTSRRTWGRLEDEPAAGDGVGGDVEPGAGGADGARPLRGRGPARAPARARRAARRLPAGALDHGAPALPGRRGARRGAARLRADAPGAGCRTTRSPTAFGRRASTRCWRWRAPPRRVAVLKELLAGERRFDGEPLREPSRWAAVQTLLALDGSRRGLPLPRRARAGRPSPEAARRAFVAGAAVPAAASKAEYFRRYLEDPELNEEWVTASLDLFNHPDHAALSLPYLRPALEKLPWIQENRRIFFLPQWVGSFVGGHHSAEALEMVDRYLADHPELPADLRRKVLEARDELERTVEVRRRPTGLR